MQIFEVILQTFEIVLAEPLQIFEVILQTFEVGALNWGRPGHPRPSQGCLFVQKTNFLLSQFLTQLILSCLPFWAGMWKFLGQNWHFYFFFEKGMAFLKGICGKFLLLEWKKSQTNKWKKEQIDTPRCMLTTRHTGQCLRLTVEKDMAWHDMLKLNVKCYS